MALRIGSSLAQKIFVGAALVSSIYVGPNLVYSSDSNYSYTYNVNDNSSRNVNDDLIADGWDGVSNPTIVISAGVFLGSPNTSLPALDCTTLPSGIILTIINRGYILGPGGLGGNGADDDGSGAATNGQKGGDAIWLGCDTIINNSAGFIFSGGGGGGGGGMTFHSYYEPGDGTKQNPGGTVIEYYGGAGGSGGAGETPGIGGSETIAGSYPGNNGTALAGGARVYPGSLHRYGGKGGGPGNPGEAGQNGGPGGKVSSSEAKGGLGGPAGKAIIKNGYNLSIIAGNDNTRLKGDIAA